MGIFNQVLFDKKQLKPVPKSHLKAPIKLIKELYKITPSNYSIYYSTKGLLPWEGGAAWGQEIQIHARFEKKLTFFFGLYSRDEIIAHEFVHALRSELDSPFFEEVFAYKTAKSRLRQILGPLFSSPIDAWFTIIVSALMPFLVFFDERALWLPFFLLIWLAMRLGRKMYLFRRCEKKHGLPKMLLMSDREIIEASKERTERRVS